MKHKVAVYGTLKKGEGNHHLLENSKFNGTRSINGIAVTDSRGYPYAYHSNGNKVIVELYSVNDATLHRLDVLEGHPNYYKRVSKVIGDDLNVWIYLREEERGKHVVLESGNWHG